jgi:hypothetical protein
MHGSTVMFHDWDSYYLLVGGAAGALIGLLFVVATLSTSRETSSYAARIYMTPTVFHFAVVVVMSGVALAPAVTPILAGLAVGAAALVGLIYMALVSATILSGKIPTPPHWTDVWCYGVMPAAIYLALGGAAATIFSGWPHAAFAVAALMMTLLMMGVRNAWDLVTYLAPLKNGKEGA